MYDLIIKNGNIIDGTGKDGYISDIGIKDGKIAAIGSISESAKNTIDAAGLTVTPGFIDSHSHSDNGILTHPEQTEKIEQGITTAICGQCGSSDAPISRDITPDKAHDIAGYGLNTEIYKTMGSFISVAKNVPQGANLTLFVGHNALRRAVMGLENRKPTDEELEKMKRHLRNGLENGAKGLSFGLIYTPSCYAETEELIELAKVAAEYGGNVVAHIRNENANVVEAVAEFIEIIRKSGARGVISHHKSAKKPNWGKVKTTVKMIEEANAEGLEIFCDVYPYIASHTSASATFIPKELRTGGAEGIVKLLSDPAERAKLKERELAIHGTDLSWVFVSRCVNHPEYCGMFLNQIAEMHGKDQLETIFDLIMESGDRCSCCYFTMCEEDVETVMSYPRTMIGTDSSLAKEASFYHPRLRGTFPRVLGRYVRERKVTSLPEMIRKMTSLPAYVYDLPSKGKIEIGYDADICIFDAEKIIDRADYSDPHARAEGLNYVILSGDIVAEDAVFNGKKMGKLILRKE